MPTNRRYKDLLTLLMWWLRPSIFKLLHVSPISWLLFAHTLMSLEETTISRERSTTWILCQFVHHPPPPLLLLLLTTPRRGSYMVSSPESQSRWLSELEPFWVDPGNSAAGSSESYPPVSPPQGSRASLSFPSSESPWFRYPIASFL